MANEQELLLKIKALDELTPVMVKAIQSMEASASKLASAVEKINTPTQNAKKSTDGLNTGVINLAGGITILKAAIDVAQAAFGLLSSQVSHAIHEAEEAEQAANKLNGALVSQGLYTKQASEQIDRYVNSVEEQTGVSGEAIKQMIAMGIQMGLSVEKSKQMEEAARKLAAATGVDVMTAFSQLQGSLAGQTKGLARVIPEIKNFTEGQLKSGAAIDIVNKQLSAQYQLYQGSFSAGVSRATNGLSNVYEALGKIIIQNPLVLKGLQEFVSLMGSLETAVKSADVWIKQNQAEIEKFGAALIKGAAIVGIVATAMGGAALAAKGLGAALTFVTGPVGIAVVAVSALTAAFYVWPGLFDQIIGSLKVLAGAFLDNLSMMAGKASELAGIFNKNLAISLKNVSDSLKTQSDQLVQAGAMQVDYGTTLNQTADKAEAASNKEVDAINKSMQATSDKNAQLKALVETYAGITIGTEKQRQALETEQQDRAKALKDFTQYLDAKAQLAFSKEEEQQMQLEAIRAKALKGTGPAGVQAGADVEINAQIKKAAELKVLHDKGVIDEQQYQQALLSVRQTYQQLELTQAQAYSQELANALGNTEEAYQTKLALDEQRYQLELQQRIQRAQELGATETQIQAMKEQMNTEHLARLNDQRAAYFDQEAQYLQSSGDRWGAEMSRIEAMQVRHGEVMGTLLGIQQTDEFKGTQDFLSNLSTLRNSHSKTAFEIGKKAALAKAIVDTASAAISAFNSMVGIPFVGPALGAAAAAAATAAGFVQIQKIQASKFDAGGQADEGMDAIPGSLAGKSFVLSQGERVVQPEANKDLTNFLNDQKGGQGGGGSKGPNNYNITLNYSGAGGAADARKMAEMVVKEIRAMSERGTPVMNEKGLVKNS